ncbi:MAG: ABC transporter ATP-binding protein [Mycobacteriaceae bacterium]
MIELRGITKRFPGVVANSDVNLKVVARTVHALVGENGAGKSTLMKILYGMQRPDEGTILLDGHEVELASPAAAIAAGIGMVHQHFMLADNMTVAENVVIGAEKVAGIGAGARARIAALGARYGLRLDPEELVESLGVGDRQRVEIIKVLYRGATMIILDEPTAVLVPQEVDELFANLRELTAEGLTVVFISHKLDEVRAVADTITVMRRGTTVATVSPREVSSRELAELMVGSELPSPGERSSTVTEAEVLSVRSLTVLAGDGSDRSVVDDASFVVHAGEVLGIAGVEGNGQAELVDAVLGLRSSTGRVSLAGPDGDLVDVSTWSTRRRREAGLGFIPEDRHRQGLLLDAPLWENRMLGHQTQAPNSRGGLLDTRGAKADTRRIVAEFDVRTPGIDVSASALSGGNQQKLIVGREMSHAPVVLIASHPTRGVDVGAQAAIWGHVRRAQESGMGVLLISADLDELIGMSDRIQVVLRGRLVAEVDPATVTPEQLGAAMTGVQV